MFFLSKATDIVPIKIIQNYYISPVLQITYPVNQYFDILLRNYEQFVEFICIGVTSLPPLGCLPGMITLFGLGKDECVDRLNYDALSFNRRLNSTSQALKQRLDDLNLVVLDLYHPLYSIILINPIQNGFLETRKGCCGTGLFESAMLCNALSIGTCSNASNYIDFELAHIYDS
ncbi:hypothetical protein G4B88_010043 [Cannabis sativa]|uniref:GDSL esterase/lipase n=1 Tax=Cannabis sativa TaxID=3483 RepID=A0A7J6E3W9_CANSA|nr:hypothetical protein G4B88_010043 [Cannabis sativa]